MMYRYAPTSVSSLVPRERIRQIRISAFERQVLVTAPWAGGFSIWGAGKNGRQFFRALSTAAQSLVTSFFDIDEAKIRRGYQDLGPTQRKLVRTIPILHFRDIRPPFITCVSLDRTDGEFERNLASFGFVEGVDYFCFS